MNRPRRLTALLFCITLFCILSDLPVSASEDSTIILLEKPGLTAGRIPLLPLGEDIAGVLPAGVDGYTKNADVVPCTVSWIVPDEIQPGRQTISGTVIPPEGYRLQSEQMARTEMIAAVYGDFPVLSLINIGIKSGESFTPVVLPVGSGPEALQLPDAYDTASEYQDVVNVPVLWDDSGIDWNRTGRYTVTGTLQLPAGTTFLQDQKQVFQDVCVMDPNTLSLEGYHFMDQIISCRWILEIDPALASVEMSPDGKNWQTVDVLSPDSTAGALYPTFLYLYSDTLTEGQDYYYRILYNGIYTDTLHFKFMQSEKFPQIDHGGDRDGGDSDGTPPDDLIQPPPQEQAPATDAVPAPAVKPETSQTQPSETLQDPGSQQDSPVNPLPEIITEASDKKQADPSENTFFESFGETTDIISGTRLRMMLEASGKARFSKSGITVTFSSGALQKLAFADSDCFTVTIRPEEKNCFFFEILQNDMPLDLLPDTDVSAPFQAASDSPDISLLDEQGHEITRGHYETNLSVATFTVDHPGYFTMKETKTTQTPPGTIIREIPPESEHPSLIPAFITAVAVILLAAGVIWLVTKRRKEK